MSRYVVRRLLAVLAACMVAGALHGAPALAVDAASWAHHHQHPRAILRLDAGVVPPVVPANRATPVEATITVANDGSCGGAFVLLHEPFLTAVLADVDVVVAPSDPAVLWAVVGLDPFVVGIPWLPEGASVTVRIQGTMNAECWMEELETFAMAVALNAEDVKAPMTLAVDVDGPEVCDGVDNDCNEVVDDGGAALCDDGDVCTGAERCGGVDGCLAGTPLGCDDGNACTTDACDPAAGCVRTAVTCDDGNACTTDACDPAAGCVHTPIPGCGCVPVAEVCDNRVDDDCDRLVDCADPDCVGSAACAPVVTGEVCGDCADNDRDGLIDAEDPDCCTETRGLIVARLRIQPGGHAPHQRLRMRLRDNGMLGTLALGSDHVQVQLTDRDGQVFCADLAPEHWQAGPGKDRMHFRDLRHRFASGLDRGKLRLRRNGEVQLTTRSDDVTLRRPVGGRIRVAMRVGSRCMYAERDLHVAGGIYRAP